MTEGRMRERYFEWICRAVGGMEGHLKLLRLLHGTEFRYSIPMDGNREEDGIELRYRFGREKGYAEQKVASVLDCRPCSVLEMMAALAIRCERDIMGKPDGIDRTGEWFWGMVDSLGLGGMDDGSFDEGQAADVIERFLSRGYSRDGRGGLFTIKGCGRDLREVEIWYQMLWYLDSLKGEER